MDDDDPEWQGILAKVETACRGITRRKLVRTPAIRLKSSLGSPLRVCVARDPNEIDELLAPNRHAACAICGSSTEGMERLAASIEPQFQNNMSYIESVWVHLACYDECTDTREQRGAPA